MRKREMITKTRKPDVKPFADLTPALVFEAASEAGLDPDGRMFALNSYENRVYQLGAPAGTLVLKFYRPGRWSDEQILEEHAFTAELAAADLPVAAPVARDGRTLLEHGGYRFAAFPFLRGRTPELDAPEARTILGRALARLHQVGTVRAFRVRPRIDPQRLGWQARLQVLAGPLRPEALGPRYETVSAALLERVEAVMRDVGPLRNTRLHGDCHLGNLLWNEQGPVFVDLDDCASGPRIQDLWMMISGSPDEQRRQWDEIMEGYRQFADFDEHETRLVEPLRGLRMLHHAAWVAHRWSDPAFPRAFPWIGEPRYWESYIGDLMEQIEAVDDPPLLR